MINTGKEFPNITLENKALFRVVLGNFSRKGCKSYQSPVYPLPILAGVRVVNEAFEEEGGEALIQKMVNHSVPYTRLVNVSWLWVIDFKSVVRAMGVGFRFERFMEINKMIHEMEFKLLHISLLSFASYEFLPSQEKVFK